MKSLLFQGGLVAGAGTPAEADLLVEDGRVSGLFSPGAGPSRGVDRVVDCRGLWVLPGRVDDHVHMMDPGPVHREDFVTGTAGAALGGCTTIIEHPRTEPPVLTAARLKEKAAHLRGRSHIDFGLMGGGQEDNVDDLRGVWEAGAFGFKVFTCNLHGVPMVGPEKIRQIFRTVGSLGGVCLIHAEDEAITRRAEERLRAEGRRDPGVIPEWRSLHAEIEAVRGVIAAAREAPCRVITAHASHPEVVRLIHAARAEGIDIQCESCPQYFHLSEDDVRSRGPWAKFTPPAREAGARDGMWRALSLGLVAVLGADHAPSTVEEKRPGEEDIWAAPFGIPGVETALPLMLEGVRENRVDLATLVWVMSENPARLWGLHPKKGHLGVGADADVVLVDPRATWTVRGAELASKAGWSPYEGMELHTRVVATFLRGLPVVEEGRLVGDPGLGQWLCRTDAGPVAH